MLLFSDETFDELRIRLRRAKFDRDISGVDRALYLAQLEGVAEWVSILGSRLGCRDADADMLLETALLGDAQCMVTGDKDLLVNVTISRYSDNETGRVSSASMNTTPLSINGVNALDAEAFAARFGDVAEHSPWVAEAAHRAHPFASREALIAAFVGAVREAPPAAQLALLRAHPDLADRAAVAGGSAATGGSAAQSRQEQAGGCAEQSQREQAGSSTEQSQREHVGASAAAGGIAAQSRREQAGAGLDRLTAAEFARFGDLNTRYRARFGFPFIFAVKGATKDAILAAFETRINNDTATERALALANVERILRFRIEDRVAP